MLSLLNNTVFQFHIDVIMEFFIKTPYFWYSFILISNYSKSSTYAVNSFWRFPCKLKTM
jgi:hypothetical protein